MDTLILKILIHQIYFFALARYPQLDAPNAHNQALRRRQNINSIPASAATTRPLTHMH